MALQPALLEVLACPRDIGPLYYLADEDFVYNPRLHLRYRIEQDIVRMLPDDAETVDDAEHERIMAKVTAQGLRLTFEDR
jgi:uncharacterized protein YbaR (Trm112 family)